MIVTCFESNEERVGYILETFQKKKYEVKVLTSNFSHMRKEKK